MRANISISIIICFTASALHAQNVLYSPFIVGQPRDRFQVIGKAGNYYWVQKSKKTSNTKKPGSWNDEGEFNFQLYDERMNFIKTIPFSVSGNVIKEYFVPGIEYLDQVIFLRTGSRITVLLHRFLPDGSLLPSSDTLAFFPARMNYGNFILLRSENKEKMALLGFETIADSLPRVHTFLYDKDWQPIHDAVFANANISQPCVQYDLVDYPLEHFSNTAVKLTNDGELLMVVPSGTNRNFLLLHINVISHALAYKEIKLAPSMAVEDIILSVNEAKRDASAGILSRTRYQPLKNVRLVHYQIADHQIDFDTSYRFNTLATNKTRNENLYEEYFMTVPGKGFMLLKEYGRPFSFDARDEADVDIKMKDEDNLTGNSLINVTKNEYTRHDNLAGSRELFDRGDLSLYYFPATRNDTCWSGIINKRQSSELSSSYLSYVFLPREDKLFFLYNEMFRNSDQYGNTTVLDQKGNALDEGIVYWKVNNKLVFQKARQISENELAIPYERNGRNGFAIVRL